MVAAGESGTVIQSLDGGELCCSSGEQTLSERAADDVIRDEDMIQALLSDCSHPTFGIGIRIGRPVGSGNDMEAFASEDGIERSSEFAIVVVDQDTQGRFPVIELPNQLPGLLGDPDLVRIGGDTGQVHSACPQLDEEEHIRGLQPDRLHGEEAASQELFLVMRHQVTPTDGTAADGRRCDIVTLEHIANRRGAGLET